MAKTTTTPPTVEGVELPQLTKLYELLDNVIKRLDKIESVKAEPVAELKAWEPPQDLSYTQHIAPIRPEVRS